MTPFLILLVIVALAGAAIAFSIHQEKKRAAKWQDIALRAGYSYEADAGLPIYGFNLFNRGRSKKNRNAVSREYDGCRITLSDYSYTVSQGRSSHTYRQTVAILVDSVLVLPRFILRPEHGILDAIGSSLGMQDIDFPEDERFSKAFVLKGDAGEVYRVFDSSVREAILAAKGSFATMEGVGPALMVNFGRRIDPEAHAGFEAAAVGIFARFRPGGWN